MKYISCLPVAFRFLLLPACLLSAQDAPAPPAPDKPAAPVPARLGELQKGYSAAVERAVKPLAATYLAQLKKLLTEYTRNADLQSALAVEAEINRITRPAASGSPEASGPPGNPAAPVPASGELSKAWLTGTKWYAKGATDWTYHFDTAGSITRTWTKGGVSNFPYELNEARRTVTYRFGKKDSDFDTLKFNRKLTELETKAGTFYPSPSPAK